LLTEKKRLLESKLDTLIENVKALKYLREEKPEKPINYTMNLTAIEWMMPLIGRQAIASDREPLRQPIKPSSKSL
jgi:hypothetical protein